MKTTATILAAALLAAAPAVGAEIDTLRLSTLYTTHVIFPTELIYADLSNSRIVAAKIVEQNRNMLAIKAREPFTTTTSVSALESNGNMHTFVIVHDEHPSELVIDLRRETLREEPSPRSSRQTGSREVSLVRQQDAPVLSEVIRGRQRLFHAGDVDYGLTFLCEDVFVYSDNTYFVLSLRNRSGVSFEVSDATFVIESRRRGKRTVQYERNLLPKGRYGSLTAAAGETAKIAYSFDKITLTRDQVLRIYLYENGGQRNLVLTLSSADMNRARRR